MTLKKAIEEQTKNDAVFALHYQKELLINEIAKMIFQLRKTSHLTQPELAIKTRKHDF